MDKNKFFLSLNRQLLANESGEKMKRFFSRFCATALCVLCSVLCAATFSSCVRNNASNNSEASTNQASALQADENQNAESGDAASEQSTSDETNDDGNVDTQSSYKSHYDDSWWQSEEYEAIYKDMKEKGYYIDPDYLPSNFDGKLKLSILDEAQEYETSLENELLSVYKTYWFFNDEVFKKTACMMFVPKEGTLFKSSLKELFNEAIALRPNFDRSFTKLEKQVDKVNTRLHLYNRDYHISPKGCEFEVRTFYEGVDFAYNDIDRLFVMIGPNEDKSAKIVFALLVETTQE